MAKEMPTGHMICRRATRGFRVETVRHSLATTWLEFLNQSDPIHHAIQHKDNYGEQIVDGQFWVDGFMPGQGAGRVWEFMGCRY